MSNSQLNQDLNISELQPLPYEKHIVDNHGFIFETNYNPLSFLHIDKKVNNHTNDIKSIVISCSDFRKKHMIEQLYNNYEFLSKCMLFEKYDSPITKSIKLGMNHIECWKRAIEINLDEVFIFEDDVYLVHNWRSIINEFLAKLPDCNIIRFDSLPYRILNMCDENNVMFYNCGEWACMGGYYINRKAMEYGIHLYESCEWRWETCEHFFLEVSKNVKHVFTSVPRLCIQDWFSDKFETYIQKDSHMDQLKSMQINHYLPLYKNWYNINENKSHLYVNILHSEHFNTNWESSWIKELFQNLNNVAVLLFEIICFAPN